MQISTLDSAVKYHPAKETHPGLKNREAEQTETTSENTETSVDNVEAEDADISPTETPGVIRNLMDGHYKGVADVRLRINFSKKLNELNKTEANSVAEEFSVSINSELETGISIINENDNLSEDQAADIQGVFDQFSDSINTAFMEFTSTSDAGSDELINSVRGSYEEFKSALGSLWDEESPKPVEETDPQPEIGNNSDINITGTPKIDAPTGETPETTAKTELQAFVGNFATTFESWFSDLQNSLESVSVLPEISQPHGNGVAFEKFMAIYNSMNNTEDQVEQAVEV